MQNQYCGGKKTDDNVKSIFKLIFKKYKKVYGLRIYLFLQLFLPTY